MSIFHSEWDHKICEDKREEEGSLGRRQEKNNSILVENILTSPSTMTLRNYLPLSLRLHLWTGYV